MRKLLAWAIVLIILISFFAFSSFFSGEKKEGQEAKDTSSLPISKGSTYYVSPDGSNSNPGTLKNPWAKPSYGAKRLKPGNTLIIRGGRYLLSDFEEDVIRPASGTSKAWITIKGEDGKQPTLLGKNNLLTAIDLSGKHHLRIENLEITNDKGASFRDGIEATGSKANHLILKDLNVHHVDEFGVNLADVNDLKIINSKITYCGFGAVGGPEGKDGGWTNILIKGSNLSYSGHYYQGKGGPSAYDRPDGFGIEPSNGPIEIANTIAEHNRGDGIDSKSKNTYIHHSIVANNFADGIKLWGTGSKVENTLIYGRGDNDSQTTPWSSIVIGTEDKDADFQIINTTVDDLLGGNYIMHVQYDNLDTPINLTIRNSIFSARGERSPVFLADSVNLTMQNNLFFMPKSENVLVYGNKNFTSSQILKLKSANKYGNPLFIKPSSGKKGDYHLQSKSPAINTGSSKAPSDDLDGNKRPKGERFDIGAYEK
ncbi:MAG: right-handed parallel beta-helix repeat-containing protein [Actinobacteria bacterium]|nr:MAG: right-handed parallel beta-helix repeat-containing protein [Actinomycetota bacterium]